MSALLRLYRQFRDINMFVKELEELLNRSQKSLPNVKEKDGMNKTGSDRTKFGLSTVRGIGTIIGPFAIGFLPRLFPERTLFIPILHFPA